MTCSSNARDVDHRVTIGVIGSWSSSQLSRMLDDMSTTNMTCGSVCSGPRDIYPSQEKSPSEWNSSESSLELEPELPLVIVVPVVLVSSSVEMPPLSSSLSLARTAGRPHA